MPIFDFQCDKCDKKVEKIVSLKESEIPIQCDCGKDGKLVKQPVAPFNFSLKGNWFKNNGTY